MITPGTTDLNGGFVNPMTSPGDMIVGGVAGVPVSLVVGTDGQVLQIVSGEPTWVDGSTLGYLPLTAGIGYPLTGILYGDAQAVISGIVSNGVVGSLGKGRSDAQLEIRNDISGGHTLMSYYNDINTEESANSYEGKLSDNTVKQQAGQYVRFLNDNNVPGSGYHTLYGIHLVGDTEDNNPVTFYSNNSVGLLQGPVSGMPWENIPDANTFDVGGNTYVNGWVRALAQTTLNPPTTGKGVAFWYDSRPGHNSAILESIDWGTVTTQPLSINASMTDFTGPVTQNGIGFILNQMSSPQSPGNAWIDGEYLTSSVDYLSQISPGFWSNTDFTHAIGAWSFQSQTSLIDGKYGVAASGNLFFENAVGAQQTPTIATDLVRLEELFVTNGRWVAQTNAITICGQTSHPTLDSVYEIGLSVNWYGNAAILETQISFTDVNGNAQVLIVPVAGGTGSTGGQITGLNRYFLIPVVSIYAKANTAITLSTIAVSGFPTGSPSYDVTGFIRYTYPTQP